MKVSLNSFILSFLVYYTILINRNEIEIADKLGS